MRCFLVLLCVITSLHSQEEIKKQKVTFGLGPYVQTQPYKDVKPIVVPSPVIFFDNSLFYVRWAQFGLYFYGDKGEQLSWAFSITAQPRPFGYSAEDSDILKGMEDKGSILEAGLAFDISYKDAYMSNMLLTDILKEYDSWIFRTEIGYKQKLGNFTFHPSCIIIYESAAFMNYYYGVSAEESQKTSFEVYNPKDGFEFGLQTYIEYPFTNKLSVLVNIRGDILPKTAQDSPLLESNHIYSGLVSLIYTLEY